MTTEQKRKLNIRPIIGLALVSLLICGFLYPFFITGIGQIAFPYQANGEIKQLNGQPVGSNLIAQNFSSPMFFHSRDPSQSASGVDPHILLSDAYSQIPRISNSTEISVDLLANIVNENREGQVWIFGYPYIDVLQVNLELIKLYPSIYAQFNP